QVGALRVESGQASGDVALRVHVDDAGGDSPAGQGAGGFGGGDGLAVATFVGEERVSRGAVGHGGVLSVGWLGDLGVEPAQECAVVGGVPVGGDSAPGFPGVDGADADEEFAGDGVASQLELFAYPARAAVG